MRLALIGSSGYWGSKIKRVVTDLGHEIAAEINADGARHIHEVEASAAIIVTPPETHCDIAIAAMSAGMDVLVEKPMAMSVADAERMHSTAEGLNLVLSVDHTFLHTATFEHLQNMREPLLSYQSLRIAPPMAHVTTQAGWDLVVHDFAILDGLSEMEGQAIGAEDNATAMAAVTLRSGGGAFIFGSREWPFKERSIVLRYPTATYLWQPDGLRQVTDRNTVLVVQETEETLKRVVKDFVTRCEKRLMAGITDGSRGVTACKNLEAIFPIKKP